MSWHKNKRSASHIYFFKKSVSIGIIVHDLKEYSTILLWRPLKARLESFFSARGRYSRHQSCALGKTVLASPPHMKWFIFQVYFSSSARLIGRCTHGSLLARGRSSVRITYFPVWVKISSESMYLIPPPSQHVTSKAV